MAATDVNNSTLILNPDFFNDITGYVNNGANIGLYVFFKTVTDPVNLTRQLIVPNTEIIYTYGNKTQIETVKYEFPVGQLFYAYTENKFYKTIYNKYSRFFRFIFVKIYGKSQNDELVTNSNYHQPLNQFKNNSIYSLLSMQKFIIL